MAYWSTRYLGPKYSNCGDHEVCKLRHIASLFIRGRGEWGGHSVSFWQYLCVADYILTEQVLVLLCHMIRIMTANVDSAQGLAFL